MVIRGRSDLLYDPKGHGDLGIQSISEADKIPQEFDGCPYITVTRMV